MTTIRIKLPKITQVEFILRAEQDDVPVRGNAMASGDDEADRKCEDEIIRQLDNGNVWAWASVSVEARYKGMTGIDYLGCCSYKDEADFKKDMYYQDMKKQAYADLISQMKALA